jgi:hypothetical protein
MAKGLLVSDLSARYPFNLTLLLYLSSIFCSLLLLFQRKFRTKYDLSLTFRAFTNNPFLKRNFSVVESVDKGTYKGPHSEPCK